MECITDVVHDAYRAFPQRLHQHAVEPMVMLSVRGGGSGVAGVPCLLAGAAVALLLAWAVGTVVMAELASPLRKYPGPFLARWTNLWRFGVVLTGNYPDRILALHRRLGPVVRIGPNTLDLDYPELIQTLYSTDTRWRKTDFYHNMSTVTNGRVTHQLFSVTDPAQHAAWKKPMVKYYSIGSILRLESLADRLLGDFCHQLDTRFATADANGPRVCDLGRWIAFCVWDTNGTTLFSKRFGYLDTGRDHDGSIRDADKALDYFAAVGQMPWLDGWLAKNPVCRIGGPPSLAKLAAIAATHLDARMQGTDAHWDPAVPDFLSYFLEAHEKDAVAVDHGVLMGYMLINVLAGADTTAITVRALFYYLLRSPSAWARLEAEVLGAGFDGDGPVAYRDARALPYLEAVVRETMRLHPGVCMLLERYVPASGLVLPGPDGGVLPPGTAVGINPWVVHRNAGVWGDDADAFRPERWLPGPGEAADGAAYRARLRRLRAADLAFGAGARGCIGRHLALVNVYKITATLVRRYRVRLADPASRWAVRGVWFARQTGGLDVFLERR